MSPLTWIPFIKNPNVRLCRAWPAARLKSWKKNSPQPAVSPASAPCRPGTLANSSTSILDTRVRRQTPLTDVWLFLPLRPRLLSPSCLPSLPPSPASPPSSPASCLHFPTISSRLCLLFTRVVIVMERLIRHRIWLPSGADLLIMVGRTVEANHPSLIPCGALNSHGSDFPAWPASTKARPLPLWNSFWGLIT